MKTAISGPDPVFARVERHARKLGLSRSEFFTRAAARWADELEGEDVTAAIDEALAAGGGGFAGNREFLRAAAVRSFARIHPLEEDDQSLVEIERGQLCWADLGEPRGSAPAFHRPVVVVQGAPYNRSRLPTVVVVAVTRNLRLAASPGNVLIAAGLAGPEHDSVVNVTQVATVDRDDLIEAIATLPSWLLEQVEQGVRRVLHL